MPTLLSLIWAFSLLLIQEDYKNLTLVQARRHVFKSGPAEVRASAEGTSMGGESTKGDDTLY